jgi:hypothetical protein
MSVRSVEIFFKRSLLQHVGTYIKLFLHLVAILLKAPIISQDELLCAFIAKGHHQAFPPVLHVFCLLNSDSVSQKKKVCVIQKL